VTGSGAGAQDAPGHPHSEVLAIGLGSNLGDRLGHLRSGLRSLERTISITACSSVYESAPVGNPDQGAFLNLIVLGTTDREPLQILDAAMGIEASTGRVRTRRWGPRTLDVDLILWGSRVIRHPRLTVPHPRWKERAFVLAPLAEVGGDLLDPETGESVAALWAARGPEMEPVVLRYPAEDLSFRPCSGAGGIR
jgi:2-amino-4-hydroxy-6-hydroxymethyldihydropteridine diphosphokinase